MKAKKKATPAKAKKAPVKKGQKATVSRTKKPLLAKTKKAKPRKKAIAPIDTEGSKFLNHEVDPAHAPGHKRMNRKDKAGLSNTFNASVELKSRYSKKTPALNRRIITGAALGKTGRITTAR